MKSFHLTLASALIILLGGIGLSMSEEVAKKPVAGHSDHKDHADHKGHDDHAGHKGHDDHKKHTDHNTGHKKHGDHKGHDGREGHKGHDGHGAACLPIQ